MKISKTALSKYLIIALSALLIVAAVLAGWFGTQMNKNKALAADLGAKGAEYSSKLDDQISANNVLQSEKDSQSQSYEDKIAAEKQANQSVVDDLNKKINDLNKQLAAKIAATSTTKKKPSVSGSTPTGGGSAIVSPPVTPSSGQTVYLTFDDGPSPNTPEILDILDRYGVKATFFVINGKYNHYMKDIVNRGHQIALHSYSHNYSKVYSSDAAYFDDLQKISDVVKAETGVESKIVRFPGGTSNTISKKYSPGIMSRLSKSVPEKGYCYFDWNCANGDATGEKSTVETQLKYCSQYPKSASTVIVLMHDTGSKYVTVEALPKIIEFYKNQGMKFGTITKDTPPIHHRASN